MDFELSQHHVDAGGRFDRFERGVHGTVAGSGALFDAAARMLQADGRLRR